MNTFEDKVVETINLAIGEAIKARLSSGYNDNPLNKIIDSVVVDKKDDIKSLIDEAISEALKGDLRIALKDACMHKLARVITSKMEGEIEKRANELRGSPETRARITLAIEGVLKTI